MATEYYILKPAVDTPETGNVYPAVESYDDYDFNAPNSVHKLRAREFPDFEPDIRFKLAKGAKLTDMLSQAAINAHGFLINKKLKAAFEQFNVVPHKYYPAKIEDHQGNTHQYFWLHLVWNESTDTINYKNSSFFIRRGLRNIGKIEIDSFEDFNMKNNEMGAVNFIDYDFVSLKGSISFDIFLINHGVDIFISEKIAYDLKNQKISGLDISPAVKLT